MSFKKISLGIMLCALMTPFALSGCFERVETERVEVQDVDPAPVVVPERDVEVNVDTNSAND